jgi:DNA-binding NtrC family response regulator
LNSPFFHEKSGKLMHGLISWLALGQEMVNGPDGTPAGPVLTLLEQQHFQHVLLLLSGPESRAPAERLQQHVTDFPERFGSPKWKVVEAGLEDPSDYSELWHRVPPLLLEHLAAFPGDVRWSLSLSTGTAAMSATWLMMVGSGELSARLLSAQRSTRDPTPRVREVRLGIYPYIQQLQQRLEPQQHALSRYASSQMQEIVRDLSVLARGTGHPILLLGETGTGKTTLARQYHQLGDLPPERFQHFVCGEFQGADLHLIQGRLFGHARGAFTGALEARAGVLEQADGGTLFLDEIGDIPMEVQRLLIEAIESGNFRRLGELQQRHSSFRLICATNRDPLQLIEQGKLAQDFYYRFGALSFTLPPLRERPEDLQGALQELLKRPEHQKLRLTGEGQEALLERLVRMPLPGNLREVQWTLTRLELFQARRYSELDADAVDTYFQLHPPELYAPELHALVRQLLEAWPNSPQSPLKWKDAMIDLAIRNLVESSRYRKKNGKPHLQAIADRLGLDVATVRRRLEDPGAL